MLFFSLFLLGTRAPKFKFTAYELRYVSQLADIVNSSTYHQVFFHILLLSLSGVPPSLGFFAKFFVLASCFENWCSYLVLFGLLFTLPINAYNYLRLVYSLSFQTKPVQFKKNVAVVQVHNILLDLLFQYAVFIVIYTPLFAYKYPNACYIYYDLASSVGFNRS